MRNYLPVALLVLFAPAAPAQDRLGHLLRELDAKAVAIQARLDKGSTRPVRVAALVGRQHATALGADGGRAYQVATYSFEHSTRDDTEKTRNDWDVQFGSGADRLHVRMVVDDASLIWDLGDLPFDTGWKAGETGKPGDPPASGTERAARQGHLYVIHTLDGETNQWARMQVLEHQPGEWILFRWEVIRDPRLVEGLERRPGSFLASGSARLVIRNGAGGGNPNRAYLSGRTSVSIRTVESAPFSIAGPVQSQERGRAFVQGGFIPPGKAFIVRKIAWEAIAAGDPNGGGGFELVVAGHKIAGFEKEPGPRRATWTGKIVLRPGDEHRVHAMVRNSSACDVRISGSLWEEKDAELDRLPPLTAAERAQIEALLPDLSHAEFIRREEATRKLIAIGPRVLEHLKAVDRTGRDLEFKTRLARVIQELGGD